MNISEYEGEQQGMMVNCPLPDVARTFGFHEKPPWNNNDSYCLIIIVIVVITQYPAPDDQKKRFVNVVSVGSCISSNIPGLKVQTGSTTIQVGMLSCAARYGFAWIGWLDFAEGQNELWKRWQRNGAQLSLQDGHRNNAFKILQGSKSRIGLKDLESVAPTRMAWTFYSNHIGESLVPTLLLPSLRWWAWMAWATAWAWDGTTGVGTEVGSGTQLMFCIVLPGSIYSTTMFLCFAETLDVEGHTPDTVSGLVASVYQNPSIVNHNLRAWRVEDACAPGFVVFRSRFPL